MHKLSGGKLRPACPPNQGGRACAGPYREWSVQREGEVSTLPPVEISPTPTRKRCRFLVAERVQKSTCGRTGSGIPTLNLYRLPRNGLPSAFRVNSPDPVPGKPVAPHLRGAARCGSGFVSQNPEPRRCKPARAGGGRRDLRRTRMAINDGDMNGLIARNGWWQVR